MIGGGGGGGGENLTRKRLVALRRVFLFCLRLPRSFFPPALRLLSLTLSLRPKSFHLDFKGLSINCVKVQEGKLTSGVSIAVLGRCKKRNHVHLVDGSLTCLELTELRSFTEDRPERSD